MTEDEIHLMAVWAASLHKIKTACDSGLDHVVLSREEIKAMMFGLKSLTSKTPAPPST